MIEIAADTSSLISLEIVKVVKLALKYFNMHVTTGIVKELEDMNQYNDEQGQAARRVLGLIEKERLNVNDAKGFEKHLDFIDHGEAEVLEFAIQNDISYLLSDDYEAFWYLAEKFNKTVFSVFVVYYLYKVNALNKEESWNFIEKMRSKRTWGDNILYGKAKKLWSQSMDS